jgi:hypothetical protein
MLIASALIDGCLVNFAAPAATVALALAPTPQRGPGDGGECDSVVHHCIFWSTFRATLRVPSAGLSLTADPAAPACGTFRCRPGAAVVHITVAADDGPLSLAERALGEHIIAAAHAAHADPAATAIAAAADADAARRKNSAIRAADVAPARARLCIPALAAASPHLISTFRGDGNQRMCVARGGGGGGAAVHAGSTSNSASASLGATTSASSGVSSSAHAPIQPPPPPLCTMAYACGGGASDAAAGRTAPTAVAALLSAASSQAREWRKCAVSFSTVMRFFQREKATFKWSTPGSRSRTVISAIASGGPSSSCKHEQPPLRGQQRQPPCACAT